MVYFPEFSNAYHVDSIIGSGSSGWVLKAFDQRLSRWVAIKLLYAFQEPTIEQEAKLLKSLDHPNVIDVYDTVREKRLNQTALVMEYLPGNTLKQKLTTYKLFSLKQALQYSLEIAKGLTAIHQQGIIHCDLKFENIFIDSQSHLKIGDFGLAKVLNNTTQHSIFGSFCCASPEQALEKKLSSQTDLFSLGLLLYQMLTGNHPFENGDGFEQLLKRVIYSPLPPLSCKLESVNILVSRLLAKIPSQRYDSAQDVAEKLQKIINSECNN
jgi:serine/threonine-protein kinase